MGGSLPQFKIQNLKFRIRIPRVGMSRRSHKRGRLLPGMAALAIAFVVGAVVFHEVSGSAGLIAKLRVSCAVIDLPSGKYRVQLALATGGAESFASMIDRLRPVAAITGTYYDSNRKPLGDIVIAGKVENRGRQRQGIGFTKRGRIVFLDRKAPAHIDWRGCASGIACGPRLVRAGRVDIDVRRDGFRQAARTKRAWRCAVGATRGGKLILCAVSEDVTLDTLGEVMLELGAWDAVNMDGGTMCAFYDEGTIRLEPAVPMSNILAVYRR